MDEVSQEVTNKLKHIVVRVQLFKSTIFGEQLESTIYIDEAKGIQQTLNAIASNQEIRRSSLWEFVLKNGDYPDKNLYKRYIPSLFYYPGKIFLSDEELSYDDYLTPNTEYTLKLTVYQKNFPFYHQACKDDPDAWDCKWYALWGLFSKNRYENNYFSQKSLDVSFKSPADVDKRTWLATFWQTVGIAQIAVPLGAIALTVYSIVK